MIPKLGAFSFFDYGQVEPRLTAYFAARLGFPEFADRLRAGEDAYTVVAKLVTKQDSVTPEERQVWKRIFLAILYGAGVRRVREVWIEETKQIITEAQAKRIYKTFHGNWPAVRALQDDVIATALRRGYIRALDGRHLRPEPNGEHKLLNKLIQGSAAGIMKRAILDVDAWLQEEAQLLSHAVSVIHDELILDGPPNELEILHEQVPRLMSEAAPAHVRELVPIVVDHEVSFTNWAEKVDYEEATAGDRDQGLRQAA